MLLDFIRTAFFVMFGVGFAFMFATNVLAFNVLRPPKKLGFLWWHVTAISLSFTLIGAVALSRTLNALGQDPTWHTYATALGLSLYAIAQTIIFNVERQRYIILKAGLLER